MQKNILSKLYSGNQQQAGQAILQTYQQQGYCIINFLYFANAMHYRLFEQPEKEQHTTYKKSLQKGDYLLPDGIALQLFYRRYFTSPDGQKKKLSNLNGTDFTPYFINSLLQGNNQSHQPSVHIAIRSLYDPKINKQKSELDKACKEFERLHRHQVDFARQCQYQERQQGIDRNLYQQSLQQKKADINILINCSGSPFQEQRTHENMQHIKKNNILIINAGGYVDFLSGFETRAPRRVRKIRIGETFRRIAGNPRKNFKKFARMFGVIRLPFSSIFDKAPKK